MTRLAINPAKIHFTVSLSSVKLAERKFCRIFRRIFLLLALPSRQFMYIPLLLRTDPKCRSRQFGLNSVKFLPIIGCLKKLGAFFN